MGEGRKAGRGRERGYGEKEKGKGEKRETMELIMT